MNLDRVIIMARALMLEHGVGCMQLGFHGNTRAVGQAKVMSFEKENSLAMNHVYYKISLSEPWMRLLPEDRVREVILHEIAHVKLPYGVGHNEPWKNEMIKMGLSPEAKFKYDGPVPWENQGLVSATQKV